MKLERRAAMAALLAGRDDDLLVVDLDAGSGDMRENFQDEEEAIYQALVLGTRDYIRKCGFQKVLIGLSGGIDSSLVAAIAVEAVGKENVMGVAMPGPFSSGHSVVDAHAMAQRLGLFVAGISFQGVF